MGLQVVEFSRVFCFDFETEVFFRLPEWLLLDQAVSDSVEGDEFGVVVGEQADARHDAACCLLQELPLVLPGQLVVPYNFIDCGRHVGLVLKEVEGFVE